MITLSTSTRSSVRIAALIPAAGVGRRFGSDRPKQYSTIAGKTVIEYTLEKLIALDCVEVIMVVLAAEDRFFQQLPIATHPKIKVAIGGDDRAASVLSGTIALQQSNPSLEWVLVHDAARPCVLLDEIEQLIDVGLSHPQEGALLAYRLTDTIKQTTTAQSTQVANSVDRTRLWAAVTPQFFPLSALIAALTAAKVTENAVTDEASAMEIAGCAPYLVESSRQNIKITHAEDLALAQYYLTIQGIIAP